MRRLGDFCQGGMLSLQRKTLGVMAVTLLLVGLVSYAIGLFVLHWGFRRVEADDARYHMARVKAVLAAEVDQLDRVLSDWAAWDDTHAFIGDLNPRYIHSNLVPETYTNLAIDVCAFFDDAGELKWARQAAPASHALDPLPESLTRLLTGSRGLNRHADLDGVTKGILLADRGPLLIASRPIVHSDKTGPIRGTIVMARWLNDDRLDSMSRVLLERPAVFWDGQPGLAEARRAELDRRRDVNEVQIDFAQEEVLSCSSTASDIYGEPVLLIEVTIPRDIHHQGHTTVRAMLVGLCMAWAAFAFLVVGLLKKNVLGRVTELDRTARDIARSKDVSRRVRASGRDELSSLANSFNGMLGELQTAQDDLRRARDVAEQANRAKSRFLADVSHEIRTPLNCIIGFADTMVRSATEGRAREHARTILQESEVLLSLINDLLDNAKMEAGRLELEHIEFNLHHLLATVTRLTEAQAAPKGLEVALHIADDVPDRVLGDPLRLRQILMNLLTNAVKFTEQGSIRIAARRFDEGDTPGRPRLCFSVSDSGVGIPLDRQEAIFQGFTQADVSTTRKHGGTGLGTTIARQLVTLMGGQIGLQSEPGRGSTFWFRLPMQVCAHQQQPDTSPAESGENGRVGRILLAEDYGPSREMMRLMLEEAGHTVTAVASGRELVDAWQDAPCDLILTDVQMGETSGFDAARQIRACPARPQVPIIVVTADSETGVREQARSAGIDDVLLKPVRRTMLLPAVEHWLNRSPNRPHATQPAALPEPLRPMNYEQAVGEFGSSEVLERVIAQFVANLEQQVQDMRAALARRDVKSLRTEAHAIKGGAGMLTAASLAGAAQHLEVACDQPHAESSELARELDALVLEFNRLKGFLADERTPGGAGSSA